MNDNPKFGYKQTEIGEIPDDWEVVKLEQIVEEPLKNGINYNKSDFGVGTKFVNVLDIFCESTIDNRKLERINVGQKETNNYRLETGDILIVRSSLKREGVGYPALFQEDEEPVIFCGFIIRIRPNKDSVCPFYLLYYLRSPQARERLISSSGTVAITNVNQTNLKNLKVPLPNKIEEQQKIAEVLSTVDEAIQKTDEVIEKAQELKKGLMQQLLTKGIGHTKFKKTEIGEIPEEWEVMRLGEVSDEIYRYPTYYNIKYVNKGFPEVRGELIQKNGTLDSDLSKYRFISKETCSRFPRTVLKEGDFVLSVRGTMGKVAIVPKELEGSNITANLIRISPDQSHLHSPFLKQYFISQYFQKTLNYLSPQTTIKTITAPVLKSIKLPLPSLPEQKKITEILSTVDEKIEIERKRKEKFEELKKGLMQVLLTGKARVKA